MQPLKTIEIGQILKLLKLHLGVDVARPTIYSWMNKKDFPRHSGLGMPRVWREEQVMKWIEDKVKETESPPKKRKK